MTAATKRAAMKLENEIDELKALQAQCISALRQIGGPSTQADLNKYATPKAIYEYLLKAYSAGNVARIGGLVTKILNVRKDMDSATVVEK